MIHLYCVDSTIKWEKYSLSAQLFISQRNWLHVFAQIDNRLIMKTKKEKSIAA